VDQEVLAAEEVSALEARRIHAESSALAEPSMKRRKTGRSVVVLSQPPSWPMNGSG